MLGKCHHFSNLWFIMFIISISTILTYPQSNKGIIRGKIIDALSNVPLPDVNIIVKGTQFGAASNSAGEFLIKDLQPGQYQLAASAVGYKSLIKEHVNVQDSIPAFVTFRLYKDVVVLPEIKISAAPSQDEPYEINSINSLSYEEIKNTPGSFDDVLRTISVLPGIAKADPFRNDMVVRGGSPSENLFLLDGLPVPNIDHYGNQGSTGGPVSLINLDYVSNVSFSAGGFSAEYGDKLSSVTSIDFKRGRTDNIIGRALFSFSGFGFSSEGPLTKNSSYIFSIRRSYLDMAFKLTGFAFTPEYYDLFSSIHTNLGSSSSLSFLFLGSLDKVKFFDNISDERKNNPRAIGSRQKNYISGITYKKITQDGIYRLSLSRNSNTYKTIPNLFFDNNSLEVENILKGSLIRKFSKSDELNLGFTGKLIEFNSMLHLKEYTTTYNDKLILDTVNVHQNYYKFEFYTEYDHHFGNGASVNLGIRYDYFNPLNNDYTISPRFSFSYPITYLLRFNFSTGIYYQTPSYIWLAGSPINNKLNSLRADHYILGLNYTLLNNTRINVEGFYKYYRDYPVSKIRPYLVLANTGAGFSGIDDNFESFGLEPLVSKGRGNSRGASFQVQSNFPSALYHILFNITYSETRFRGLDGITRPGSYDQKWNVNILAGYKLDDLTELNIKFSYASGRPYTPFDEYGTQDILKYNTLRFKPQHSLDLRINRYWEFPKWKLSTFIDIQNIYNRKNKNYISWDKKQNKIADDPIMGILPSIGIITELF